MTTKHAPHISSVVFEAKPGKEKELQALLTGLIEPSRKEEGCIIYDLHRCKDDPKKFLFHEIWTSEAALNKHQQAPHLQAAWTKIPDLLAKPIEAIVWEKI
jgi:quinol monooxygenase YgiN